MHGWPELHTVQGASAKVLGIIGLRDENPSAQAEWFGDPAERRGRRSEALHHMVYRAKRAHPTPSATNHVGFVAAVHLTWCTAPWIMRHVPNHVGFGISPELNVVQDRVHGWP